MTDTRETLISNLNITKRKKANKECGQDIPEKLRPKSRFQIGDEIIHPNYDRQSFILKKEPYWDYEFSGWLIAIGLIGVHECNYILKSEEKKWIPYKYGLWSYWKKRR